MLYFQFRKMQAVAVTAAAMICLAGSETLAAAEPAAAPFVTYTATGVFADVPISGNDLFELAGKPFSISVYANAALAPTSHGSTWAKFTKLTMSGTITSGIEPMPQTIFCPFASLEFSNANPTHDTLVAFAQITVIGIPINVQASINLKPGTLPVSQIRPLAPVAIGSPDTVTYACPSNSTTCTPGSSTTLGIASGSLIATIPTGGADSTEAQADVQLHVGGAQVITGHADGTKSVRSMGSAPVDLGVSSDVVALQFYASGVRDGSEIHVQIAGHDVQVLYAGPANYFHGLDEVSVAVPRSLAGSGNVDVALTVDGRTAEPVHIQLQ